jgi:hypothetical protein
MKLEIQNQAAEEELRSTMKSGEERLSLLRESIQSLIERHNHKI